MPIEALLYNVAVVKESYGVGDKRKAPVAVLTPPGPTTVLAPLTPPPSLVHESAFRGVLKPEILGQVASAVDQRATAIPL